MNARNINQAMLNRANMQYEIKDINNRINDIVNRINGIDTTNPVNGVDVEFTMNENITSAVLSDILSGVTGADWANDMSNFAVYEASDALSYISGLNPANMWKCHVIDANNSAIADDYKPLESFIKNIKDNTVSFTLLRNTSIEPIGSYGGTIMNAITPLLRSAVSVDKEIIESNISDIGVFNTDSLYFLQYNAGITTKFGQDAHAESFTLHFE